jgi:arylamine N-acetyltransferase
MFSHSSTAKEKMTTEQINLYLRKIGVDSPVSLTFEDLKTLQTNHMQHIPFENLDQLAGKITSLAHDDLFDKIIRAQRGGIGLELNALYCWLLVSIGFSAASFAARLMDPREDIPAKLHRVLCVELDGKKYMTDVGMDRESPRMPLLLEEDTEQNDGISVYKFTKNAEFGWLLSQNIAGRGWQPLYCFTEEPQFDEDFAPACFFCDQHPASSLNKSNRISIFTADMNIVIAGDTLRYYKNGRAVKNVPIENKPQMSKALASVFNIVIGCAKHAEN